MSIELKEVSYIYNPELKKPQHAVRDVSLTIEEGKFYALIGHTGSGKSTMVQFLNGLMRPTGGEVLYEGKDIFDKEFSLKELRTKVGLVFQYPEHQLFETEVFKDVCFGPKNMGLSREEIESRAKEALDWVGLGEDYYEKSPFELSGGEKRRVSIAGILAMRPKYLVLDEPTAGLDPKGRDSILDGLKSLNKKHGMTIILVTHSMENVAEYADHVFVMNSGNLMMQGTPKEIFARYNELENIGLSAPEVTYVCEELKKRGFPIKGTVITVPEARDAILEVLKNKKETK